MTIKNPVSKLSLTAILASGLLLTGCGGSSSSGNAAEAKGAGVDYSGKTTAAELPSTEER